MGHAKKNVPPKETKFILYNRPAGQLFLQPPTINSEGKYEWDTLVYRFDNYTFYHVTDKDFFYIYDEETQKPVLSLRDPPVKMSQCRNVDSIKNRDQLPRAFGEYPHVVTMHIRLGDELYPLRSVFFVAPESSDAPTFDVDAFDEFTDGDVIFGPYFKIKDLLHCEFRYPGYVWNCSIDIPTGNLIIDMCIDNELQTRLARYEIQFPVYDKLFSMESSSLIEDLKVDGLSIFGRETFRSNDVNILVEHISNADSVIVFYYVHDSHLCAVQYRMDPRVWTYIVRKLQVLVHNYKAHHYREKVER